MDMNKAIAKHALSFIGGTPQVFRYDNTDKTKAVDIMTCKDSQYSDVDVYATIGLAGHDTGLFYNDKSLRIELMAVGPAGDEDWANIIASAAFEVIDMGECGYGTIISNVVGEYKKSTKLRHVLLLSPNYWQTYAPLETDGCIVVWLMAIPISDSEREFIVKNGPNAFEEVLGKQDADIFDLDRQSFV